MAQTVHIAVADEPTIKEGKFENILRAILRMYRCDKLILLIPRSIYPEKIPLTEKNNSLRAIGGTIEYDEQPLYLYDFDEVFNKTVELIRKYHSKKDKVYINLSDAPRITLIAMMSAAYFVPQERNLKLLFSTSEKDMVEETDRKRRGFIAQKSFVSSIVQSTPEDKTTHLEVPIFPTQKVSDTDKKIMRVLNRYNGVNAIKKLIDGLSELEGMEIKRSSLQYRLDKLEEMGMIERESETREVMLALTPTGEMYISAESS